MANMHTVYTGDLKTRVIHRLSGTMVMTDAPPDNNGKGEFFSPTDLVASALASCMLTVMGILAERNRFSIDGTEAFITKVMGDNPRRIAAVDIELHFPARPYSEKEKAMLEQAVRACPVAKSLHPELEQRVRLHFQ